MAGTILSQNIIALRKHLGLNQAQFGELMKSDQTNVSRWESKGVVPGGVPLAKIAERAKTTVEQFTSAPWHPPQKASAPSDHQPTRSIDAGETATVMRMDLSYAMGPGTNIDEDYFEGEPVELDISFLRRLTPSSPDMLRIVNGAGDSMQPTIHDSEELILDLGQRTLNMQDRIWAISLYGVGAVKRLQASGKGRVLVVSDNPDVPNREVDVEDIIIVGRVVGSIRRH
jgi:phage repressor protein C with HTH and peptisase S24 domain